MSSDDNVPANSAAQTNRLVNRSMAEDLGAARAKIAQLETAVEHRTVIGQAVGIVMERFQIDADNAFSALTRVSSTTNRKIYAIADEISRTGTCEGL